MNDNQIFKNIQRDLRVELHDEFDRNFERKGFFGAPWKQTRLKNSRGSILMRSGKLRRGQASRINGNEIIFTNSMPYAKLQNEGGEIVVTAKMKKFFWAMHYKAGGAIKGKGERAARLTVEAMQWKALALKKVGSVIKIEKRQWLGWHPVLHQSISSIVDENMKYAEDFILNKLRK